MKHKIYEFSLFFKILYFVSKGFLNISDHRCLLIGLIQLLYTKEPAVKNIAYFSFKLISVTLLSMVLNLQIDNSPPLPESPYVPEFPNPN